MTQMVYKDLTGKVAVITGGSKGIGNAIAKRYGEEKMKVVINYNSDKAGADKAVQEIKDAGGDGVAVQADISSEEGVQKLLDAAVENFGDLDVWINNAGMENQHPTNELSLKDWQRVIDVNLTGAFLGSKAALNYFLKNNKKGNIINMSSVHEQIPWPTFTHYAASKGGVKLFTETIAMEYAEKVSGLTQSALVQLTLQLTRRSLRILNNWRLLLTWFQWSVSVTLQKLLPLLLG